MAAGLKVYELKTKDIKGNTRIWRIWAEGASIITEYGTEGGKLQRSSRIAIAKNVGKITETSPEIQAQLEVERDYIKHKGKKGGTVIDDTDIVITKDVLISPMLAKPKYVPSSISYPVFIQPKLDGVRAIAVLRGGKLTMYSRNKKIFNHFDRIKQDILSWGLMDIVLDGEVYSKHLIHEDGTEVPEEEKFQTLQKAFAIARKDASFYDFQVQYHIFDIVDETKTQKERIDILSSFPESKYVKIVETHLISNESEGDKLYDEFLKDNYEGAIYRPLDLKYEQGARRLMKRKSEDDEEFEIVGFKDGIGKMVGCVIWRLVTLEGLEFDAVPLGSMEDRREWFVNGKDYIGKLLTVKFDGKFKDGVPRFPIGKGIRDFE